MNELQIFENEEFGKVRTVVIDNEPWMVGKDVADALDIDVKVVNGAFTSGIQKKGYGKRIEAEVEYTGEDGNVLHKKVKFLTLTPEGVAFEPEASEE